MAMRIAKKTITLEGHVAVEDAEILLDWLKKHPGAVVTLKQVQHLHAAVLQVLLALRPRLRGTPEDTWLGHVLAPAIDSRTGAGEHRSEIRTRD